MYIEIIMKYLEIKKHMEIRIDEVTTSEEDTKSLGISVGDFVSLIHVQLSRHQVLLNLVI